MQKILATYMHLMRVFFLAAGLLVAQLLLAPLAISSQSIGQQYLSPDERMGLPTSYILETVEDEFGFLWFATSEGLIRFDGYSTTSYVYDNQDENSIPSNFIRHLFIDSSNRLWVGTIKGLAIFDRESETFKRVAIHSGQEQFDVWSLTESNEQNVIVATTDELFIFDEDQKALVPYNKNIRFPNNISSLLDEPSRLWIGTFSKGGYIYDKRSKQLFSLSSINPWAIKLDAKQVRDIKVIDGRYWLATNTGLALLDSQNSNTPIVNYLEGESVLRITSTHDNIMAITASKVVELSKLVADSEYSISSSYHSTSDGFFSLFIDKNGTHWLGTDNGIRYKTIYTYNLPVIASKNQAQSDTSDENTLQNLDVWGLDESSDGLIWSATQNGEIQSYDPISTELKRYNTNINGEHWGFVVDDYDRFWVSTDKGLSLIELEDDELVVKDTLFDKAVYNITHSHNKVWLILDNNELVSIDYTEQGYDITSVPLGVETIQPFTVHTDAFNRLWISSYDDTLVYDIESATFLNSPDFFKNISPIMSVIEKDGVIWLVSLNKGITAINSVDFSIVSDDVLNSQEQTIFSGIGTDKGIWFTNGTSIKFLDTENLNVVELIRAPQINNNKLYERVILKTGAGLLGFGGKFGYHLFDPGLLERPEETAVKSAIPIVSEFRLNAELMPFKDERSPLQDPIYLTTQGIKLTYLDKRFTFTFAVVNPKSPLEVEYRYKLEGYDTKWTPTEDIWSRRAAFHNIPWGQYTLLVQAKEANKTWSDSARLPITISPPPWFSAPAIIVYVVLTLLMLIYLTKHLYQKRASRRIILESEERLKLTLWSSGDELWDWDVLRGQVHRSNTWGIIDFPQDNIRTNSAYQGNIHSADIARVQQALNEHLEGKSEYYQVSYRARTFKNKWIWVLDRGKVVSRDHNKQALRVTGTLKNIQHLKEAEEQMKLFERSIENISEGVFITDTSFKFISVNSAYCKFTGESKEQALASFLYFHQYPGAFTEEVRKALTQRHNWSGEIESKRINGESYEIELNIDAVLDDDGKISHYVGVFSDITARKATEKELLKLANADPLTDLPNRSFFQASQQNLVRRHENHTLLCLDMDNFKKINDSLGHQTGDVLIKQIAKRLQRIIGKSATCYRLGGDEFSILIEDDTDIHTVAHYAQNILDNLSRPFIINKQEFVLGASLGIAFYPDDGSTPQEMLKNADTAMYFAKNSGGNTYKFFSGEMNQNAVRQLQIENLIRQGLKDDLFTVFYQPKVDIASGRLVSMEALVRFEHPQKGIVSPSQFIPLAEQSGQIIDIGEVVLEKALRDTKRWVDAGIFNGRVAVNISAKQFELDDLDDRISKILNNVGISSMHLECEITEGTLMENPEQGLELMQRLREKGIHLALDDFGTGYSSLAYLKRFPLNTLKIDKAFIDDIAHSNVDRHMAAAIINIAHNLSLNVVAEGVEFEEQLAILRRYDCEMLQGYLYSKPLRADNFEKLLTENLDLQQFLSKSSLSD